MIPCYSQQLTSTRHQSHYQLEYGVVCCQTTQPTTIKQTSHKNMQTKLRAFPRMNLLIRNSADNLLESLSKRQYCCPRNDSCRVHSTRFLGCMLSNRRLASCFSFLLAQSLVEPDVPVSHGMVLHRHCASHTSAVLYSIYVVR